MPPVPICLVVTRRARKVATTTPFGQSRRMGMSTKREFFVELIHRQGAAELCTLVERPSVADKPLTPLYRTKNLSEHPYSARTYDNVNVHDTAVKSKTS